MDSSQSSRGGSTPSYSPRSPIYAPAQDMAKSPRERLEDVLSQESSSGNKEGVQSYNPQTSKSSPLTTPKEGLYHPLRNVSAPIPSSTSSTTGGGLRKQYPAGMASAITGDGTDMEPRFVPRTSSIDSTLSTVSSATSYSYNTQDQLSPNATEVAHAISTAGSAEGAIHQLLKEQKQSLAQNAQLWRLVNNQRTLVLGLNKDLGRALQDKDRYRKKLRELLAQPPQVPMAAVEPLRNKQPPPRRASPTDSDSQDELPIQRHSVRESVPSNVKGFDPTLVQTVEEISPPASSSSTTSLPLGSDGRKPPLQGSGQLGAHQATGDETGQPSERFGGNLDTHGRVTPPRPPEIHKKIPSSPDDRASPTSPELDKSASRGSFTARRSITNTTPRKPQPSPLFDNTTPHAEDFPVPSPGTRKAPPAPLTLHRPGKPSPEAEKLNPQDFSDSEYEDMEVDELPAFERGRRKTREDDDREREIALLKEQESRSISKKSKRSKSATEKMAKAAPPPIHALPKSPFLPKSPMMRSFSPDEPLSEMQRHLSPPTSLAGVLSRPSSSTKSHSISERGLISPFPLSPGLPLSPRPADRPVNSPPPRLPRNGANSLLASPPLSPRIGLALPLSPRPPRREIPLPPQTPTSLISPMPTHNQSDENSGEPSNPTMYSREAQRNAVSGESDPSSPRPWMAPNDVGAGGIYRGLLSDSYPDLLLPPNALPSILVKVTSSRLKPSRPSRHSMISSKESEEPVFTLGISARSDFRQLWRVERATTSLPQLDQRLKKISALTAPLPDRSLFTGHAPAKIDARRIAIERYFEAVLDTPMNEEAALHVCQYLSAQAIEAEDHDGIGRPDSNSPVFRGPDGRISKEGYLTKRGKNFGGWKARYFVLDEPSLRYYESPGGPLLGTIKLINAVIGRQPPQPSTHSPSRINEESDKEFRHAFLIAEPKRNNSGAAVRHILCAESDEERDEWVSALFEYVNGQPLNAEKPRPTIMKSDSASSKFSSFQSRHQTSTIEEEAASESNPTDPSDALQALSYEDTAPAPAPANMPLFKKKKDKEPASPVPTIQNLTISGPSNANIIQDASAWGNKAPDSPKAQGKEQRKRSIWGNFRADKASSEALASSLSDHGSDSTATHNDQSSSVYETSSINERPAIGQAPLYHRAVFSVPLAEAVEMFAAMGSDSGLPSVVYRCLEYLEAKQGVKEQGIFRVSGGTVLMRNLETRFNTEGDVDLLAIEIEPDVHAVAGLLKTYFRKLPSPVLTQEVHMEIVYASSRRRLSFHCMP